MQDHCREANTVDAGEPVTVIHSMHWSRLADRADRPSMISVQHQQCTQFLCQQDHTHAHMHFKCTKSRSALTYIMVHGNHSGRPADRCCHHGYILLCSPLISPLIPQSYKVLIKAVCTRRLGSSSRQCAAPFMWSCAACLPVRHITCPPPAQSHPLPQHPC